MAKDGLLYVIPAEGRTVRDPYTKLMVPREGMLLPAGEPHWMASLNFGDLIEGEPPPRAAKPEEAQPAEGTNAK